MLGKLNRVVASSEKRTARARVSADRSGLPVLRARGSLMGGITPEGKDMPYRSRTIKYRSSPRNAPSRSKIEAHKTGRDMTPTAPGRHGMGDNCATELPRVPLIGGRAGSRSPSTQCHPDRTQSRICRDGPASDSQ